MDPNRGVEKMKATTILAVLAVLTSPAMAADLPAKAPVAPQTYTAGGLFIGINGAGAQTNGAFNFLDVPGTGNLHPSGGMAGLTAGYGLWTGRAYFGLEVDADFDFTKQNVTCATDANCKIKQGWFFTQRAVVGTSIGTISGVAASRGVTPQGFGVPTSAWAAALIPYITGGVAERRLEACIDPLPCGKEWLVGWTVGGGLKMPISTQMSLDLTYLYVSWNKNFSPTPSLGAPFTTFKAIDEQILKVGLSYHL
jgi:opacity protein-like surface antigen